MLLLRLGVPLSWKKTMLVEINTWLGFEIIPSGPFVQMACHCYARAVGWSRRNGHDSRTDCQCAPQVSVGMPPNESSGPGSRFAAPAKVHLQQPLHADLTFCTILRVPWSERCQCVRQWQSLRGRLAGEREETEQDGRLLAPLQNLVGGASLPGTKPNSASRH